MAGPVYGERYWVPHDEQAFVPAMYKALRARKAVFQDLQGNELTFPAAEAAEFGHITDTQLEGVSNICEMSEVSRASVMHTLRMRFLKKNPSIYTRVSQILIAVNPFQQLPIYTSAIMRSYVEARDSDDLPPHIFGIGHCAVRGLDAHGCRNQVVLVSGESGAGKTESTKLVLSYVSESVTGGRDGAIQEKIMNTNPILESFGNAMTERNNNSSRFGKFIEVKIARNAQRCMIKGCMIEDYLLEQTRVVGQSKLERNYHVFYQLLKFRDFFAGQIEPILDPSHYRYVQNSRYDAPGVNDETMFEDHIAAYRTFGFTEVTQLEIFKIVMGILQLGNTDFIPTDEHCTVNNEPSLNIAAAILGINPEALKGMLITHMIKVGSEMTVTGRTVTQAEARRDCVARQLYGRLFKYIVKILNKTLMDDSHIEKDAQWFGILDIAGFESFELNSIEQLFINLSNEHLQAHFNNEIFKMELDDYKSEGIAQIVSDNLSYKDNSDIIALIDSKTSILATLDEEISVPRATDMTFLNKITKKFEGHPRLVKAKTGGGSFFTIEHFAGKVSYTVTGFLEKNVDKPPPELVQVFESSSLQVLKDIAALMKHELEESAGSAGSKRKQTVSSGFRQSLIALIAKISTADPHFVRCIRPNSTKVPQVFDAHMVMNQLNFSGIFEAVRIRQAGYAHRVMFTEFLGQYAPVLPRILIKEVKEIEDKKSAVALLVQHLPNALSCVGEYCESDCLMGKTKVFCRSKVISLLNRARDLALLESVIEIQRVWQGYSTRKSMKEIVALFHQITQWEKVNGFYHYPGSQHTAIHKLKSPEAVEAASDKLAPLFDKAKSMIFEFPRPWMKNVEYVNHRMKMEAQTVRELKSLGTCLAPLEIERVLVRAMELELTALEDVAILKDRLECLRHQLPLIEALNLVLREISMDSLEDMKEVLEELAKHDLDRNPTKWLKELDGFEMVLRLKKEFERLKKEKTERAAAAAAEGELETPENQPDGTWDNNELTPRTQVSKFSKMSHERGTRRSTLTGKTEEETTQLLLDLIAAIEVYDMTKLEARLDEALKHGVQEQDVMNDAQKMFNNMQREQFLIDSMNKLLDALEEPGDESHTMEGLQNLINHASNMGMAQDAVAKSNRVIQDTIKSKADRTNLEHLGEQDFHLATQAFADLSGFPGLRNPDTWRGHKPTWLFGKDQRGVKVMLTHNTNALLEPLMKLPRDAEKKALAAFNSILGCMYDKPAVDLTRTSLQQEVVSIAETSKELSNEVYLQIMKQLTDNQRPRSYEAGWKLLLTLLQSVAVSPELREYLYIWLYQGILQAKADQRNLMKRCLTEFTRSCNISEQKENQTFSVKITLADMSHRKFSCDVNTTIEQLTVKARDQLKLRKEVDWSLFQCIKNKHGDETHRLIRSESLVVDTMQKWKNLQDMTGRGSTFVLKRYMLLSSDVLDFNFSLDARLTLIQALQEFKRDPILQQFEDIWKMAARILHLDKKSFAEQLAQKNLQSEGVLDQLVSARTLKEFTRRQLSNDILRVWCQFADEPRHVTMSKCFMHMQKKEKLFGTLWWRGRQVSKVEESKVSITDEKYMELANSLGIHVPKDTELEIHPDCKRGDLIIAVDVWGIRFLRPNDKQEPGMKFCRGFLFSDTSWEKIILWGAKSNVVQFVVQTEKENSKALKGKPASSSTTRVYRINVQCSAAVNICYALHNVYLKRDS